MLSEINFINCTLVCVALVHFYVKGISPTQLECVLSESYLPYLEKQNAAFLIPAAGSAFLTKQYPIIGLTALFIEYFLF